MSTTITGTSNADTGVAARRAAVPSGPADRSPAPSRRRGGTPRLHEADNPASSEELRARGTTVIADRVFEKIGGQAASEIAASRGRSGGVLGIGSEADSQARPKVDVDLSADSVDFDIAAGIAYPGSIRAAAQQIRSHVSDTVHQLTGVPVHRVDIDVTFLTTPPHNDNRSGNNGSGNNGSGEDGPGLSGSTHRSTRKQVLR